jgi:hypothetical protein
VGSGFVELARFPLLFATETFFSEQRVEFFRDLGIASRPDRDLENASDVAAARLTALSGSSIDIGEKCFRDGDGSLASRHGIHFGIYTVATKAASLRL